MARFVLIALLAALTSPASAGPCAIPTLAPAPMKRSPAVIASGGGVLVTLGFGGYGGHSKSSELEQKGWRYRVAGTLHRPTIRVLAPGLAVYQLPPGAGPATLIDDNKRELVTVEHSTVNVPELPAPNVKSIVHGVVVTRGPRGGESRSNLVHLAATPPAGTVGIILYKGGKATSWVDITGYAAQTEYAVFQTAGRCSIQIPGLQEVAAGERATIAWVDASGRVSAKSKEFVVGKGKRPANAIGR